MESPINKIVTRRNMNSADPGLVTRSNGHEYSLRSTGRPVSVGLSVAESAVPEAAGTAEGAPSCPARPSRPPSRPPSRKGSRKSRRSLRRYFARAFIPVLFMTGAAATYLVVEWRLGLLREALDDLVADSSSLRDHFLSLSELLNEQVRLVEDRVRTSVADRLLTQLWLRDNDKTGVADFALESAGAQVVSMNGTEPWPSTPTFLEAAFRPNPKSNGPRQLLKPGMSPGECWAFRGSQGEVIIRLVAPIRITSVSIEHITKNVSPTGTITSAPREFLILGLQETQDPEEILGRFIYQTSGPSLQTFHLPVKNRMFMGPCTDEVSVILFGRARHQTVSLEFQAPQLPSLDCASCPTTGTPLILACIAFEYTEAFLPRDKGPIAATSPIKQALLL